MTAEDRVVALDYDTGRRVCFGDATTLLGRTRPIHGTSREFQVLP